MENQKPFAETLQTLLDERGHDRDKRGQLSERVPMSQRELTRRLGAEFGHAGKIGHTTIRKYFTGELFPSRSAMERIAKVLRVDPNLFAEYRLEVIRDDLNWRKVGTRKALRALDRLRG